LCCQEAFPDVGQQYLVVATRWLGTWATTICHGTASVQHAARDLAILRKWKSRQPARAAIEGRVYGLIAAFDRVRLLLTSDGLTKETRTDPFGYFRFPDLPQTTYRLSITEPGWLPATPSQPLVREIDLTGRTCALPTFSIRHE
jgi:hypothetical protein